MARQPRPTATHQVPRRAVSSKRRARFPQTYASGEANMRPPLTFHYSLNYGDFMRAAIGAFTEWVEYELNHGGTSAQRIDYKFAELVAEYVPTSPRQLMELTMQCEALLDVELEDPIFGYQPENAYEALRIALSRHLADELEIHWEERRETLAPTYHVIPLSPDGVPANGGGHVAADPLQDS
jgi:hypothetical protein